jgi:Xaa-Pro aminopeptidase
MSRPDIAAQLRRRRELVAKQWDVDDAVVLIGAGMPIQIPGRADRTYPFRSHSEYFYLTDRQRPGGILAFDASEGWIDFVVPISREEMLWEGARPGDNSGRPMDEFSPWLNAQSGRRTVCLGVPPRDVPSDPALEAELRGTLNEIRRQKDDVELGRMRRAETATRAGFATLVPLIRPGVSERDLQIELEASFYRNGGDTLAFDTIIGSGPNSAVLHATPTARAIQEGELVLVDAGAECCGYASDVTRTYPASGSFTAQQAEVYALVARAAAAAIARCVAGTEFTEIHRSAALVIADGLVDFGLLHGDRESLVELGAQAVFFPHGVGHLLGLGVRDAGEVLAGRQRPDHEFPRLRIDLPLLASYVVTIEPGVYFVPALVNDQTLRDRFRDAVDWQRAEEMLGFGGIRIESNVLVTDREPEVLTSGIPFEL